MELPSLWKANVCAFSVIFLVAVSVALWQTHYVNKIFLQEAQDHARLAAQIAKINAEDAVMAKRTSQQIVATFLKSQARFIRYLQNVEPFTPEEIWAFAKESGLSGVSIVDGNNGTITESRKGWISKPVKGLCDKKRGLILLSNEKLFVFVSPWQKDGLCIVTGIDASNILEIQRKISLENTLRQIARLSGVKYARVFSKEEACRQKNGWGCPENCDHKKSTRLLNTMQGPVVQVEFPISKDKILVLGMDARELEEKQKNIWALLIIFSVLLFVSGGAVTWLLYKHQKNYVQRLNEYEKRLLMEKHEASLGRSAATIAHEIRNPLNAVSMGVQRLLLDRNGLSESNREMLVLMKRELERTEAIVSGLLEYARPSRVEKREISLKPIIREALVSAQERKNAKDMAVNMKTKDEGRVLGDAKLLRQVFENLFVNCFEAQPSGGEVAIELERQGDKVKILVSNRGKLPSEDELKKLFEPYFTTKTKGTGLGLTICQKIVRAHGGNIRAQVQDYTFIMEITLPSGEGK